MEEGAGDSHCIPDKYSRGLEPTVRGCQPFFVLTVLVRFLQDCHKNKTCHATEITEFTEDCKKKQRWPLDYPWIAPDFSKRISFL